MENELVELKRKHEYRRRENSFYVDMVEKESLESSNVSGNFSSYTYHIDSASKKMIRSELK